MRKIALLMIGLLTVASAMAQMAVGHWRDCMDYHMVQQVQPAGDRIYAAAHGALFCYDISDGSVTTLSRSTGLSDAGIATITYDSESRRLVVAYNNSNIDIIYDGKVYNLADIKRSEISGDKRIYRVRCHDGKAYLATGFGVVVVDLERYEIKETCLIGTGGVYTTVRDLALTADSIYAATDEGLKRIALDERHLTISDRWVSDGRLADVTVTHLEPFAGRLVAAGYTTNPDAVTLYALESEGVYAWNHGDIRSVHAGAGRLAIARSTGVVCYDGNLQRVDSLTTYIWGDLSCYDAVTAADGILWVGHEWDGLIAFYPDGHNESYFPVGPYSGDNAYRLVPFNRRMMLCIGGHTVTYSNAYLASNLQTTQGGRWQGLDDANRVLAGTSDLVDVAVNPYDTTEMVAALWGSGVVTIRNNVPQMLYNESNTDGALMRYSVGDYSTLLTGAVAFDGEGNLWVLNSHSTHALARRNRAGQWSHYSTTALADLPQLDKLLWDSVNNYLWFCGRSNMIYVHDGQGRMARVNPNNGSLLSTDVVNTLVQDRSGNLWVGTNKGIKVIYDPYHAFYNGGNGEVAPVNCSNITITNGEYYEYLMAYEGVTAIAVDGANRKWVGTSSGGLYLISATGTEQLEHFTAENSPLLSNKIVALGIQPRTGEVYVGTDAGLQVYRATATYAETTPMEEIYAFPNPVRPDYDGPIAIKGFTRDAKVHITDAAGHTVYSTTALGGQAIWYGRTANGERVASGVYYVFAADDEGGNRSVAKILIVR